MAVRIRYGSLRNTVLERGHREPRGSGGRSASIFQPSFVWGYFSIRHTRSPVSPASEEELGGWALVEERERILDDDSRSLLVQKGFMFASDLYETSPSRWNTSSISVLRARAVV